MLIVRQHGVTWAMRCATSNDTGKRMLATAARLRSRRMIGELEAAQRYNGGDRKTDAALQYIDGAWRFVADAYAWTVRARLLSRLRRLPRPSKRAITRWPLILRTWRRCVKHCSRLHLVIGPDETTIAGGSAMD